MTTLTQDSIEMYLRCITENGFSPNTAKAYKADLMGLLAWAGDHPQDSLTSQAASYLTANRSKWSPRTMNRKKASIRSWGRWAGVDLLVGYRSPTPSKLEAHPLPGELDGVLRMLSHCHTPHEQALVALMGLVGLRVSEALAVEASDIVGRPDGVWLHVRGKGSKRRHVPLHPAVVAELSGVLGLHPEGRLVPMADRTARAAITAIGERANLGPVASHDLRMTAGTVFYRNSGNDLRATQEFLGHADGSTTEGYTHVGSEALRRGADFMKGAS